MFEINQSAVWITTLITVIVAIPILYRSYLKHKYPDRLLFFNFRKRIYDEPREINDYTPSKVKKIFQKKEKNSGSKIPCSVFDKKLISKNERVALDEHENALTN